MMIANKLTLLLCFLLFPALGYASEKTAAIPDSPQGEYKFELSCNDLNAVEFIEFYEAPANTPSITTMIPGGTYYHTMFQLTDEAAARYLHWVYNTRQWHSGDLFINGMKAFYFPEGKEEDFQRYRKTYPNPKLRYLGMPPRTRTLEEAIKFADTFCPEKVVRDPKKMLKEWPRY